MKINNCWMRHGVILFFILFFVVSANSQTISSKVDSITKQELAELPPKKNSHYDSIMYNRAKEGMYQRLDTLQYDYVFITESSYRKGTDFSFEETYIYEKDSQYYSFTIESPDFDSIPSAEYIINRRETSNLPMDTDWFLPLLRSRQEIKPFQKTDYDKIQKRRLYGGKPSFFNQKIYHRYVKRGIKNTWRIQTFIVKNKGDVKVSIQSPPKQPKFFVRNEYWIVDF